MRLFPTTAAIVALATFATAQHLVDIDPFAGNAYDQATSSPLIAAPVPATGWGNFTRGTAGIPRDWATKSPCGQNSSVTSATAGMPSLARLIPSRTVPVVQEPQCP